MQSKKMEFHKDVNIELISKVVLLYVSFPPLHKRGLFPPICSMCCFCPICKILSIKHSEQLMAGPITDMQWPRCAGDTGLGGSACGSFFSVSLYCMPRL